MYRKFIFLLINFFLNNKLIFKIKCSKFKTLNYGYDFLNVTFENFDELKEILLSKKYFNKIFYDEKSYNYHTFGWLNVAKKIGGANIIPIAKHQIINWNNKKYKIYSFVWNNELIAKRLINLIFNYDFYAISATNDEKEEFRLIILKHYFILKLQMKFTRNKNEQPIEITKALLLFHFINKIQTDKIFKQMNFQLNTHVNVDGLHKSINPCMHAEYINELYEIKNMCLFFNVIVPKNIEYQIINMSSVLKSLFHKDKTIALFNGSNNANYESIIKINNLQKDIKPKNLSVVKDGLAIFESNKFKIFFDITKPTSKLLSLNLHTGTFSFEVSYDKEKIITNCGSIEKRVGKKPEFLRFSAAHSTIVLNNTNISELVEKKAYKRIPKMLLFRINQNKENITWEGSHDGYRDNFKSIIKRKLLIPKNNFKLIGQDSIIPTKRYSKKILYNIRFHLTPICQCVLTNNQKSVFIKTKNHSWVFESENKLKLENSIYISDGLSINKTKQIVISGYNLLTKKTINWSISKIE